MANDEEARLRNCPMRAGQEQDEQCQESDCMMWAEMGGACLVKMVLARAALHLGGINGGLNDIASEIRQVGGVLQARLPD